MLILIASTRAAKVEGVREAIRMIAAEDTRFAEAEIRTFDVTAAAPRMPMSEAEIIEGARTRAEAVLPRMSENQPPAFAIGVEGGVDRLVLAGRAGGRAPYTLKTWACVTDGHRWSYGAGGAILLPDAIATRVAAGEELGDIVDAIATASIRGTRGAWGLLTRDLITRRDAFRTAVVAAFAPFYNCEQYDY